MEILIFLLIAAALSLLVYLFFLLLGSAFALSLAVFFILSTLFIQARKVYRFMEKHQDKVYSQHECRQQLEALLEPRLPLPSTRGYRGSPDFLLEVCQHIIYQKPACIVEASSGISTLICASTLQRYGLQGARVISLENDADYAEATRKLVARYGLSDFVTVIHAPLVQHQIEGSTWLWYDLAEVSFPAPIDFLIIDGPPRRTQKQARFPALPLLYEHMRPGATVVLDDAARKSETAVVKHWKQLYPDAEYDYLRMEKGMAVVRLPESSAS